jgi:hypothetical protein
MKGLAGITSLGVTAFGLQVHSLKLDAPPYDFDAAFRALAQASPQMLLVLCGGR